MNHSIESVCDALKETLVSKNANYGNSAFQRPSLAPSLDPGTAILVRLSDKFARLQTLLSGEPDRVGESIRDTMQDIAGYCVLYLATNGGDLTFKRPVVIIKRR